MTSESINRFLSDLTCSNAKHAYYRALRAFCNWATREGYTEANPIAKVDPPKINEAIFPTLSPQQMDYLISVADNPRDKCIISLFADSGMRLSELASMKASDIDWQDNTVTIWGKGNKQRRAAFLNKSALLLRHWLSISCHRENIWGMKPWGIVSMLARLEEETGLKCNPHTFRRTFASNLHRAGMDIEHIMRLGGWSSLDMVLTYTKSVKFEDSHKIYKSIQSI